MDNGEHGVDDGSRLSKHTTPTWEVELLISGVAVFAMLQLPGRLDDAIFALRPRFTADWSTMLAVIYLYAKSAAVLLAATFVVHLVLRARWIALVGMHSIYPQGIAWDRLRLGPNARRVERARMDDVPAAIERADNGATTVFAIGVTLALLLVVVTLVVAAFLAVPLAIGITPHPNLIITAVACVVAPYGLLQLVDRRFGAKLAEDGAASRLLRLLLRAYGAIGMGNARNIVFALLASHGGRARVVLATGSIMVAVTLAVSIGYFNMREPDPVGSYGGFPAAGEKVPYTVGAAHYGDRRDAAREGEVPYVRTLVAAHSYLEVLVPYRPSTDEPAMQRECPQAHALSDPATRVAAELACLARIHALTLDGRALSVAFDTSTDPDTGRPVLLAMVDVRALAPGRHELRTPRLDAHEDEPKDYVIPFWR
jgi:hypothetical protein